MGVSIKYPLKNNYSNFTHLDYEQYYKKTNDRKPPKSSSEYDQCDTR